MITDFIFSIPAFLVGRLLSLLPAANPNVSLEWVESLHLIWSYIQTFDFLVPVEALLFMLFIVVPFHVAIFLWHGINWVLKKIPGVN